MKRRSLLKVLGGLGLLPLCQGMESESIEPHPEYGLRYEHDKYGTTFAFFKAADVIHKRDWVHMTKRGCKSANPNSQNLLGMSAGDYLPGDTAKILVFGHTDAIS